MILKITAEQACRLVLWRRRLVDRPRQRLTAEGVADLVENLGFLQVDSISTVERAHHMILFARAKLPAGAAAPGSRGRQAIVRALDP